MTSPAGDTTLAEVIERARRLGLVGRRSDAATEIARCEAFVQALRGVAEELATVVDLGSGNGLPGLVVARELPVEVVLVEVSATRCAFLRWAVGALGWTGRVEIAEGPVEELARREDLRGCADAVVARAFAGPATTAECAVGFVRPGGLVLVAEPPGSPPRRWPRKGLAQLSLVDDGVVAGGIRVLRLDGVVGERWPRRAPRPRRDPVF